MPSLPLPPSFPSNLVSFRFLFSSLNRLSRSTQSSTDIVMDLALFRNSSSIGSSTSGSHVRDKTFSGPLEDDDKRQNIPSPIANRPLRGEKRIPRQSDHPLDGKFRVSSDRDSRDKRISHSHESIAHAGNFNPKDDKFPIKEESHSASSEDKFLEKFRLGNVPRGKRQHDEMKENQEMEEESQPQDAEEIFKKMKETGLVPNAVAMLDGLCKDGLVQEAMKLFGLMREKGTFPEVVVYTAVVEGFCKAQRLDDAKRIFRKMQSNGISPNAFTYGVLIRGLSKGKRLDDAVEFCVEMLEAGHAPNVVTFVDLVNSFCSAKGVDEAKGMIERLKQKGYGVDDKAVRDYLDKRGPFVPLVREAIFGKKGLVGIF